MHTTHICTTHTHHSALHTRTHTLYNLKFSPKEYSIVAHDSSMRPFIVCRTANVGRLSVKLLSSSAAATEVSTSAVASHIKLDVDTTSHLFVGGVSKDYKV